MRIAIIHDWFPDFEQEITWMDGLAAAIRVLSDRHEIKFITCTEGDEYIMPHPYFPIHFKKPGESLVSSVSEHRPDAILHWADTTRISAEPLSKLGIPMALCFAGGEANGGTAQYFQHIFVESEVYKPQFIKRGIPVSTAFGTNTELFKPIEQAKTFDTIFPATFATWKRHELYAQATKGLRSLACGYMYTDHEQECWQVCLDNGVTVLTHVSAQVLHYLYAASRVCVIPSRSDGGSQRTVLEAMAMNVPMVVCDSDKFDYAEDWSVRVEPQANAIRDAVDKILVEQVLGAECDTRGYVLKNWSEYNYADALEKGLMSICRK